MKKTLLTVLFVFSCSSYSYGALAKQYQIVDLGDVRLASIAKDDSRVVGVLPDGTPVQVYPSFYVLNGVAPGVPKASLGGRVVGEHEYSSSPVRNHGFLYINGAFSDVGGLQVTPDDFSSSTCVNADGDIYGFGDIPHSILGTPGPLVWKDGVAAEELPSLYGLGGGIEACNDLGDSSGYSIVSLGGGYTTTRCTIWRVTGEVESCHPGEAKTSISKDMNNLREVVGDAITAQGRQVAFVRGSYYLLWLYPFYGDTHSYIGGTNDAGDVVGRSCSFPDRFGRCRALRWDYQYPVDLHTLVINRDGWNLQNALGTSNDGKILVEGTLNGSSRLALLIPVDSAFVTYWNPKYQPWIANIRNYWRALRFWYRERLG